MIVQSDLDKALIEYYMPYAMKVITDRALPDIKDGLKPIARRILWTLWKHGIKYNTSRDKCGKIVGDVLRIHNHGDTSAYLALALLTEQNESLLHPFIDGGGAFGKIYSKDKPSAMRYTSAKLNEFSEEMFKDINKNVVKFIGEDKDHMQPLFLNNTFPNILIKPNSGVAVGEACNWCSFNLIEVCNLTEAYIKNKDVKVIDYLTSPDFSTGSYIITNNNDLEKIYSTGKGSFKLQAKYKYNEEDNAIEIYEIPYNSTVEDIIKDVNGLISSGKIKDINDIKDTTSYDKKIKKEVLGILIELKRNTDPDKVMKILYKKTRLRTSFSCNFNCLVDYRPKVLGIKEILDEWLKVRIDCVKKSLQYDILEKEKNLHFLKGLERVLLNIDKAIEIIRHSETDDMMIENLIREFKIDEKQATDISNMKLRNINQQYIIKRITIINKIEEEITELNDILNSEEAINNIIIQDLNRVKIKYGEPRKTEILHSDNIQDITREDLIEDYNCKLVYTKDQYIKKLNKSIALEQHKLKDNDIIVEEIPSTNKSTLLLFTNKANRYKLSCYELDICNNPSKALGEYLPNILNLEDNEEIIKIISIEDEVKAKGHILSVFENGKISKVNIQSFISNNKKILNCYNTNSKLLDIEYIEKDVDIFMVSQEGKGLVVNSQYINKKQSRTTQGVNGMNLGEFEENKVISAVINPIENLSFTLKTEKGKDKNFYLDDVAPTNKPNETRSLHGYIQGRPNNQGNFLINCRSNNDKIVEVVINK